MDCYLFDFDDGGDPLGIALYSIRLLLDIASSSQFLEPSLLSFHYKSVKFTLLRQTRTPRKNTPRFMVVVLWSIIFGNCNPPMASNPVCSLWTQRTHCQITTRSWTGSQTEEIRNLGNLYSIDTKPTRILWIGHVLQFINLKIFSNKKRSYSPSTEGAEKVELANSRSMFREALANSPATQDWITKQCNEAWKFRLFHCGIYKI